MPQASPAERRWMRKDAALRISHPIAAAVHLASATFILAYGISEAPRNCISAYNVVVRPRLDITKWYFSCYNATSKEAAFGGDCTDADKIFYSKGWRAELPEKGCPKLPDDPSINILVLAALFAYWSGLWHVVASVGAWASGPTPYPGSPAKVTVELDESFGEQGPLVFENLPEGTSIAVLRRLVDEDSEARCCRWWPRWGLGSRIELRAAGNSQQAVADSDTIKSAAGASPVSDGQPTYRLRAVHAPAPVGRSWRSAFLFTSRFQQFCRWMDYIVSAPLMLMVFAVIFGAPNFVAVRVMPAVLALLLLIGWRLEPERPIDQAGNRRPTDHDAEWHTGFCWPVTTAGRTYLLIVVSVLYVATWAPPFFALQANTHFDDPADDATEVRGRAPAFVSTMLIISFIVFSSFVDVYFLDFDCGCGAGEYSRVSAGDGVRPAASCRASVAAFLGGRERMYTSLSMIAKVVLHTFVGLAVVRQTATLKAEATAEGPSDPPDTVTNNNVFVATGAVVGGAFVINAIVVPLLARIYVQRREKDGSPRPPPPATAARRFKSGF